MEKGVEYLDDNRTEDAIYAFKQAIELDEGLADAHFQLGVALSLKETEEERLVPDEDDFEDTGRKKAEKEKPSEVAFKNAIKAYKRRIAKDRKDHEAHFNMGRAYGKLYEDKDARKALEKAVKHNGEDAQYRTELGAVLIKLAQYPQAIKQLNKALELEEDNYRAEDLLAKAKAGKKRVDHVQKPRTTVAKKRGPVKTDGSTRPRKVEPDSVAPKDPNWPPPAKTPAPKPKPNS